MKVKKWRVYSTETDFEMLFDFRIQAECYIEQYDYKHSGNLELEYVFINPKKIEQSSQKSTYEDIRRLNDD